MKTIPLTLQYIDEHITINIAVHR